MKEKLYTIPLNDAIAADDECALCFVNRELEQDALDFVVGPGASYMESDIREATDEVGFCRDHLHKMFAYGNSLGNGLILKTHLMKTRKALSKEMQRYQGPKASVFTKSEKSNVESFLDDYEGKCYVCNYYKETYERYIATFFYLYEEDAAFVEKVKGGKGFCLCHMKDLLAGSNKYLKKNKRDEFAKFLFEVQDKNLARMEEDISWFCDKFDYRYKDADWKNSKDALPRTVQKLVSGYPLDGPYKGK